MRPDRLYGTSKPRERQAEAEVKTKRDNVGRMTGFVRATILSNAELEIAVERGRHGN